MGSGGNFKYKLNSGTEIPAVGLGTVAYNQEGDATVKRAIINALKAGYRHFDTAWRYQTEPVLGEALADAFKSGLVKREEVFVTTKIWIDDLFPEQVPVAFHKSLSCLGLQYVDLYLMHFPLRVRQGSDAKNLAEDDFLPLDLKGVWQEIEKLHEQGLIKAIGVSNFNVKRLQELLNIAKIPPAVNQMELHPLWQSSKLLQYCKQKRIHVTAYSPLGAPGQVYGDKHNRVLNNPVLTNIGTKHGKTAAQISLRWILEQGASLLPKSYNQVRLTQNFDIFDWSLTKEDLDKIKAIPQEKIVTGEFLFKGPYKTFEEFWGDDE